MFWLTWYYHHMNIPFEAVSGRAGIHPERLRMIEAGEIHPTDGELQSLANAIGWQSQPAALMGVIPDWREKEVEQA